MPLHFSPLFFLLILFKAVNSQRAAFPSTLCKFSFSSYCLILWGKRRKNEKDAKA